MRCHHKLNSSASTAKLAIQHARSHDHTRPQSNEFHTVQTVQWRPENFTLKKQFHLGDSQYLLNKASSTDQNDSSQLFNRFEVRHHHGNNYKPRGHWLVYWSDFIRIRFEKLCQGLYRARWRLPVVKQNCRLSTPLQSVPSLYPRVWTGLGELTKVI